MSTLGDLLAEHTVLPGNAVDHLHAVVGEWQLLADLSFADYLMWVRRDDGALVCVAQCRPNTAATVLLTDAVGTIAAGDDLPLVTAAFQSGCHRQRGRPGPGPVVTLGRDLKVEAVPVRYGQRCGGGAHPSDGARRRPGNPVRWSAPTSTAPATWCTCCPRALSSISATWRCRGRVRASATDSSGSTSDGTVSFASPNALSAYHRMGLTAELEGHNLVADDPSADLRPVRGPGTRRACPGFARRRVQHAAWRSTPAGLRC